MAHTYKRLAAVSLILCLPMLASGASSDSKSNDRSTPRQANVHKTSANTQFHGIKQGFNMAVWMGNMSCMGLAYNGTFTTPDAYGLEYPKGRGIEHLYGAGPWMGALIDTATSGPPRVIKAVTTGYQGWTAAGQLYEMFGNPDGSDSFYVTSDKVFNGHNRRGFDDDADGRIDEDELNGIDDDHDGLIDEDYGAVSEHDAYVSYSDFYGDPNPIPDHVPLGIRVWQRSFAWASDVKEPILPIEYYFMNVQNHVLNQVYVGFFADADVGPKNIGGYYTHDYAAYLQDVRTAYIANPQDRPSTPMGFTVLGTPKALTDTTLKYTFQWYPGEQSPSGDRARYDMMTLGQIKPDEWPALSDTRFFFSFGPFDAVKPGDTLKIVVALVSGEGILTGPNNLRDNAAKALELYARGWTTPPTPPSPPMHVTLGHDRVTLDWKWHAGDARCDPLETWDDSNSFVNDLPPDHWRRRHPEERCDPIGTGGRNGGRTFQGFRVWRSDSPIYDEASFALLAQYDVYDGLGFAQGGHLEDPIIDSNMTPQGYTYTDSNLVRGRHYWYAVTSFSIPGLTIVQTPNGSGGITFDTLTSSALESGFAENDTLITIPFAPSTRVGEVKVVPNPYRTDHDYTAENGGWEGLGRNWTESERVIWFIHLPAKCTIRIFTLTGDIVATLEHDDPTREALEKLDNQPRPVGQEEWHLLSQSGRAVASGVYIYSVESMYGRQIGKFVIIR